MGRNTFYRGVEHLMNIMFRGVEHHVSSGRTWRFYVLHADF